MQRTENKKEQQNKALWNDLQKTVEINILPLIKVCCNKESLQNTVSCFQQLLRLLSCSPHHGHMHQLKKYPLKRCSFFDSPTHFFELKRLLRGTRRQQRRCQFHQHFTCSFFHTKAFLYFRILFVFFLVNGNWQKILKSWWNRHLRTVDPKLKT